jgi:tetratricopeptide (TPR) repeat protein
VASPQHAAAWHGWGLLEKDQGNYLRARDLWLKGIQALRASPNAYLYQSLAVLAAEMDCVEEARKWFREGTRTVMGRASHALWQAWALMEQRQGDRSLVRALLKRGLEARWAPRERVFLGGGGRGGA